MPASTAVGTDTDTLDIAGPQGTPGVQHTPLNERRMADQVSALPHQGMHTAESVLPIVLAQFTLEDVVQQRARGSKGNGVQCAGVSYKETRFVHATGRGKEIDVTDIW